MNGWRRLRARSRVGVELEATARMKSSYVAWILISIVGSVVTVVNRQALAIEQETAFPIFIAVLIPCIIIFLRRKEFRHISMAVLAIVFGSAYVIVQRNGLIVSFWQVVLLTLFLLSMAAVIYFSPDRQDEEI